MCYNIYMLSKKIRDTIKKHNLIKNGEHIVIGLSGGPDSVCLFDVLMKLKDEMNLTIHPVHVNHKFRPGDAERDQEYVEQLCRKRGVECRSFEIDCVSLAEELSMTSEEAGRKARYDAFFKVASEISSETAKQSDASDVKIAVAQNANDQAETMLFRLLRGTGTDGLAGIAYERDERGYKVIRPLLDAYRNEIEAYCEENGLEPVTDHTNLQPVYARNRIRLQLLPLLEKEYNSNIMEAMVRLGRIAASDKEYLWQQAEKSYGETLKQQGKGFVVLDREKLSSLHRSVRRRVMMKAFAETGLSRDITEERLEAADKVIMQDISGTKTIEFPFGYSVKAMYGAVMIDSGAGKRQENTGRPELVFEFITGENDVRAYAEAVKRGERFDNMVVFDYDKLTAAVPGISADTVNDSIIVRKRGEGDFINLGAGRKKLRRLMMDMKLPAHIRDDIWIAAAGREVLWMMCRATQDASDGPGNNAHALYSNLRDRFAEAYRPDDESKRLLIMKTV